MMERAGITVMLNELSSTVVFERPLDEVFVRLVGGDESVLAAQEAAGD